MEGGDPRHQPEDLQAGLILVRRICMPSASTSFFGRSRHPAPTRLFRSQMCQSGNQNPLVGSLGLTWNQRNTQRSGSVLPAKRAHGPAVVSHGKRKARLPARMPSKNNPPLLPAQKTTSSCSRHKPRSSPSRNRAQTALHAPCTETSWQTRPSPQAPAPTVSFLQLCLSLLPAAIGATRSAFPPLGFSWQEALAGEQSPTIHPSESNQAAHEPRNRNPHRTRFPPQWIPFRQAKRTMF